MEAPGTAIAALRAQQPVLVGHPPQPPPAAPGAGIRETDERLFSGFRSGERKFCALDWNYDIRITAATPPRRVS